MLRRSVTALFLVALSWGGTSPPAALAQSNGGAASSAPADTTDPDGGWPRSLQTASGATIVLYQPQVLDWKGQKDLLAMAAVSYIAKGASKPELGTIQFKSPTSVSMEERMVNLEKLEVGEINFSSLDKNASQEVLTEIRKSLPGQNLIISLDRMLAMVDRSQISGTGIKVKTDAPPIFYSTRPAILVGLDGAPVMAAIEKTTLKYVVNTNWDVFQDTGTGLYYLRHDQFWYQSPDFKAWEPVNKLPKTFESLPDDDNWKEVKANIPGRKADKKSMPTVFVSQVPAELLLLDGEPKTKPVTGTNLLWVSNTESDLFRVKDAQFYFLVSGRWFRATSPTGPWTFATADLPQDFKHIPPDHERAAVLSSVPGTEEAAEAILLAEVPQTARVNAKEIKAPEVTYSGDPQFSKIEGSTVSYATNTSNDVMKVGDLYYMCFQGVWFMSRTPTGPWSVTTSVPDAIYAMPPSAPVYHVTYVVVVNPDPYYPTYAYTSGYMGVTVSYGCVMYGTGYYHPPYVYYPPYGYPVYHPWPPSYGCAAVYNPYTGAYGYKQAAYGPYGGVSRTATYNPHTGTYKRSASAYGPYGSAHAGQAYNPRTGGYASTVGGSNAYGSWNSSYVQRGDDWARTQRTTDAQGNTKWSAQGSGGGSAKGWNTQQGSGFVGEKNGDMYAGKDGNVYRKTDDGWQQYENGNWNNAGSSPKATTQQAPGTGQAPAQGAKQQPATSQAKPSGTAAKQPSQAKAPTAAPAQQSTVNDLDRQAGARERGDQRTQSARTSGAHSGGGRRR